MAGCDYYSCDKCGAKTFYDASIDWEFQRVGAMAVICPKCAEDYTVVVIPKAIRPTPPPSAEAASGWRTMESAPKDGALVLLGKASDADWPLRCRRWTGSLAGDGHWRGHDGGEATHWMPLPEPPKEPFVREPRSPVPRNAHGQHARQGVKRTQRRGATESKRGQGADASAAPPHPTRRRAMSAPAWETAPSWANWLAMDADGGWYWFEYEPEFREYEWIAERGGEWEPASDGSGGWRESKQQRPAESWPKGEAP